ncbi:MAG: MFS transporter [Candidatus Marsarchaeota archaeon]|jgi:putative MFS transporter|nr:MFS transporter [Candidatus Marsarchaeota archaeon]
MAEQIKDDLYIGQRIDRLPNTSYHLLLILVAGAGFFFDIFDIDTMSATAAVISKTFHMAALITTLTISMAFLGMFFGSIFSGRLADKYGRKRLFVITLLIIALGSFLTFLSTNVIELWFFRFITGFGIGGDLPVIWAYLGELSPSKFRGKYFGYAMIIGVLSLPVVGLSATALISAFPVYGWRYVFLLGALIAVVIWPLRAMAPESPRWYLSRGRKKEAEKVMTEIETAVHKRFHKPLPAYKRDIQYSIGEYKAPLSELFKKDVIGSTVVASVLWIFQTWGFYGFTAFLPLILIAKGYTLVHAIFFTAIGWTGGFLGPVLVSLISDRYQRKYLLGTYAIFAALFIFLMGLTPPHSAVEVILFAFLVNIFIQAWAATLYIYVPEIFPARVRASGGGLANGLGRGFNVVGLLIIGVALAGIPLAQLGFTAISWLVCVVVIMVWGIKTSKRALEDITEKKVGRRGRNPK